MKGRRKHRFLCALLSILMIVSLLPTAALAAEVETSTWEKVDLADITADDVVAITMTKGEVTYVLPTEGKGGNGQPLALTATVSEDGETLSAEGASADFGWTITAAEAEGTFKIHCANGFLYIDAEGKNNGVRIGTTEAVWSLSAENYLTAKDTDGALRYLGAYKAASTSPNPDDWRAYTTINNNIKDETLGFWKYTGSETPEPTTEPTEEPVEKIMLAKLDAAPADGDTVVIYHPGSEMVLTATVSGSKLAGTKAAFAEDQIEQTDAMAMLKVSETDGVYVFELDGKYLTSGETGNSLAFAEDAESDLAKWTLEQQDDGTWYIKNVGANYNGNHNQALEYYSGFTTYGVKDNNAAYKFEFYAEAPNTDPVSGLKTGDTVAIFNDGNGKAMTATASGSRLAATDAALDADGKLSGENIALFTVTVNDDGAVSFVNDGKFLTSGATGSSLTLAEAESEYSLWAIEDGGDGLFFVKNVNAKYNNNPQYLEYYNTFTTYGKSATAAAKAYAMSFREVAEAAEDPVPATPTAVPAAGEVAANTEVTFSCATEGAVISYSTDNGETWTEGTTYTVTEAVTLLVKATKDGVDSEVATFAYTIKDDTPEPTYNTIAEALAGAEGTAFTVKGVVTMVDGKNVYVQDETGGICLYLKTADSSIQLGDTVIGSGAKKVYRGLPELDAATVEKSSGMTLKAKQTTIGALTTADVCTYVQLKDLEVTEVYDNNGAYSAPNITLKDKDGATIQIYKAVVGKDADGAWAIKVGDKVDVYAAVGINNTTLQLRNTIVAEITPVFEVEEGLVTDLSTLKDGDTIVVYNPASGKAMSETDVATYYRAGVDATVTDDKISGYDSACVWTLGVKTEGDKTTYTFTSATGRVLTAGTRNSLPMGDANPDWTIEPAATEGCVYIRNAGRDTQYVEWYASKNEFSAYQYAAASEAAYAMQLYRVTKTEEQPTGELKDGDRVVIYNATAEGSLGLDNSGLGTSLGSIPTDIREGVAYPNNGAYVFTVGVEGDYYTFSAGGKYLSTCNTEQLFMADEKLDTGDSCAYWQLEKKGDGYLIKSKTARYNGTGVVVIEFYSDAFSGWTFKSDNQAIFLFNFYPVHSTISTLDDVTNVPRIIISAVDAPVKQEDYTVTFELDDLTPLEQLTVNVTLNGEPVTNLQNDGKHFSFLVPAEVTAVESALNINVLVTNASGDSYSLAVTMLVQDIPVFSNFKPEPGSETGDNKMPLISADVKNVSDRDSAVITIAGKTYPAQIQNGVVSYQPTEPLKDGRTTVRVEVTRQDGAAGEAIWSFVVGTATTQLYFGQLHSHTTYSDGSGSLPTALEYVKNLPESANVQFVAFTDHSNYFDSNSAANPEGALYDMSLATASSQELWKNYRKTVADFNASQTDVIAIAGFEMTWSGGPGHINTFNSPGIVSRNNATLNQKTNDAGMKSYYALLSRPEGAQTLSQFNHPGKTFGNFTDFSYWDAVTDSRIFLVEVGNGEGQIGAGGYYPSYEQYIMALDKGWHVAPTNNQDNHKGRWGNANDARDVILTDDFTEEGIYQAIRDMRVYATEDKNLEVYYTVNEQPLGSSLTEVPEQLNVNVQVNDPDSGDKISKVEVVVNSGKVVHTWDDASALAAGTLTVTLAPNYSYYFIRVTEADGDLAVTAPVWVGETLKLGISAFESETAMPVTGEELTLKTTLYNSEGKEATIKNITYTTSGSKVLGVDTTGGTVPASGTKEIEFKFTPEVAKVMTITVTVVMEQDGKEFTFTKDLTLDVQNADELVYIGIDASHHNEYVAGNYKDSMGNFANLAAEHAVRTVYLKTSEELIDACGNEKYKAIILTVPSRRDGTSLRNPYENYTDAEIAAIAAFNANGGTVVLTGWSDYYEHYAAFPAADHMAAQQNRILAALGSSLRISDDGTNDDELNGGQKPRLYFDTYNMDNPLMAGVVVDPDHPNDRAYSEVFSHYGGASIYAVDGSGAPTTELPATVCPAVYAHATTYSWDSDDDGIGGASVPKYPVGEGDNRLLIMATEELPGKGLIVVSGAAFLSNFEVQAQISDGSSDADTQKNYSNYKVCENLISPMNTAKVSDISDVRAVTEDGFKFTIEGVVTSNASGYDKDTAFFDCIYVQDDTAGICCFPVAGTYKIGDKVRITGTTDFYQGEPELQVTSIAVIGAGEVAPQEVSAKDVTSRSVEGKLITVKGTVESFEVENGLVQTIMVKDENGDVVRVFIDGYITTANEVKDLENGCDITVTGLASYDDTFNAPDGPFPRIRIRDRADVVCTPKQDTPPCDGGDTCPSKKFKDVDQTLWYHEAVDYAIVNKLFNGTGPDTFEPDSAMTRGMLVTVLHRMEGSPAPKAAAKFTDLKQDWYKDAVAWASENGIVNGMGNNLFAPDQEVTREQAMTMLMRYAAYKGMDVSKRADLSVFKDGAAVSSWAIDAVRWAVAEELIKGMPDGTFQPQGMCTRAQVATILMRFLEG